jgi:hypothetical protein
MRNRFLALLFCLVGLPLVAAAQLISLPPAPALSIEGRALIYEFEVGGAGRVPNGGRPEWPGFASGVTVGIGYDCGYNSRAVILSDWRKLTGADRLAATAGFTGQPAKAKALQVRDIIVSWGLASEVFDATSLVKFWQLTSRTFPGFEDLRPNCQAALVSLVFNRGNSLAGPKRVEMRAIRELVPREDYAGIARQIRAMKRIWRGTDIEAGMVRRREAEARLVETR